MAQSRPPKSAPPPPRDARSLAEDVLAHAQSGREVVQDFVPLADSLEWELGQEYLRQRGNKAFLSDASPVPFVINNDGTLSRHAAEVFFVSLVAAEKISRFFLDHFRDLCRQQNKDYYDRLCLMSCGTASSPIIRGDAASGKSTAWPPNGFIPATPCFAAMARSSRGFAIRLTKDEDESRERESSKAETTIAAVVRHGFPSRFVLSRFVF